MCEGSHYVTIMNPSKSTGTYKCYSLPLVQYPNEEVLKVQESLYGGSGQTRGGWRRKGDMKETKGG